MPAIIVPFAIRRDTASGWTTNNPILLAGQEGYETDTRKRKVGNGTSVWTALAYDRATGAAIGNADGTLVDVTAKFNTLLAHLRSTGDIAP